MTVLAARPLHHATFAAAHPYRAAARIPTVPLSAGRYEIRFARSDDELDAALRLRFEVFNLELGEGLAESLAAGRDADEYDLQCDHLLVVDRRSGDVVGTYRMQTSEMAAAGRGFYAAGEFDLSSLPDEVRAQSVELGRACVARAHRNTRVLFLLWQGIGAYLLHNRKRFLFGCCSSTGTDPAAGLALARSLAASGAHEPDFRVRPRPGFACAPAAVAGGAAAIAPPRLFGMYLAMGARVCSDPAIDRAFGTIDFLVLLDVAALDATSRARFLGEATR